MRTSNQFPVHHPSPPKNYGLYAGGKLILGPEPYPVLVYRKKKMEEEGHRFLKIKPIK